MHIICSYLTVQAYKYSRDVLTIDFVHTVQTKQTWMFGLGSLHAKEVHSFHIYAVPSSSMLLCKLEDDPG